jgi:hypothetical protein
MPVLRIGRETRRPALSEAAPGRISSLTRNVPETDCLNPGPNRVNFTPAKPDGPASRIGWWYPDSSKDIRRENEHGTARFTHHDFDALISFRDK